MFYATLVAFCMASHLLSFCYLSATSLFIVWNFMFAMFVGNAKRTNTTVGSISPLLCEASKAFGNTI